MPELFGVPPLKKPDTAVLDAQWMANELIRTYDKVADLEKDALLLYEPQEIQAQYHASRAANVILIGGTRCLAGWQEIYDPVLCVMRRIDSIDGEFHVLSRNPANGKVGVARASKPFVKSHGRLRKFTLGTGEIIYATREHRVLAANGRWVSIGRAYDESISLAHQPACAESGSAPSGDVPSLRHTRSSSQSERDWLDRTSQPDHRDSETCVLPSAATKATIATGCHVSSGIAQGSLTNNQAPWRRQPASSPLLRSVAAHPLRLGANESCPDLLGFGEDRQASILDTGLLSSPGGVARSTKTTPGSLGDCLEYHCSSDARLRVSQGYVQSPSPSQDGVRESGRFAMRADGQSHVRARTHACRGYGHHSSTGASRHEESLPLGDASEFRVSSSPSERALDRDQEDRRFGWLTDSLPNTDGEALLDSIQFALTHPARFQLHGVSETIVSSMEDAGQGDVWDLTVEGHANYLCAGLTNANSGKTTAGCIEDARCVTNSDPHKKYPKKGTLMLLGYGWSHIGRVFYPMLFRPGAFKIIRDLETRKWRAYRPWLPEDAAREAEVEDAPPLIHPRYYDPKDIAWESKGQDQFVRVKLNTGWEIMAFSSESDPRTAQGFRVNRIHIDEDLSNESWVGELTSRKAQDKGLLHWTAVPHSRNESMLRMVEEAEKDLDSDDPTYVSFRLPFLANMHITADAKKRALREWASEGEDVLRMRSEGEFTYDSVLMYPTFNLGLHGYRRSDLPQREVPKDWTRFAAIDPGSDVMGVLFAAIPPDNSMVLVYDELYIKQCDAVKFGVEMLPKTKGLSFYAFIMDYQGARLRDLGGGKQPIEQYREQLEKRGIRCEMSGSDFIPGSTDKPGRAEAVRLALRAQDDTNKPRFRVLLDDSEDSLAPAVPHLVRTLKRYRKKTVVRNGVSIVIDEPETRGDVHMAQVAEYLFAFRGLHYVEPRPAPGAPANWEVIKKQHEAFLNRGQRHDAYPVVHFGPASVTRREYA